MNSQIHQNDVGTKLVVKVTDSGAVVDISSASSLSIFIKKPDGTLLARVGTLLTDGTDGIMYYIVEAGDLDMAGNYKIQGRVSLPNGTFNTTTDSFMVHCNL